MTQRTIEPDDLFRMKFLTGAKLSPDGTQIIYAVSHVVTEEEKEYVTLWLHTIASGETRQVTTSQAQDTVPAWSPDGNQIAFISTRGEDGISQIYLIAVDGGEARQLTTFEQGVSGEPVWSPNGKKIAFTAPHPKDDIPDLTKPYRVTRRYYRYDGMGNIDTFAQDIYTMAVDGADVQRLTNDHGVNTHPIWSPDGRDILYYATMLADDESLFSRLRIVNHDGDVRDIPGAWRGIEAAAWLPEGKRIVLTGKPSDRVYAHKSDVWVVDLQSGDIDCRTSGMPYHIEGLIHHDLPSMSMLWAATLNVVADGSHAYVRVLQRSMMRIYRVALSGDEACEMVIGETNPAYLLDSNDRQILYAASTFTTPPELYLSDSEGEHQQQISWLNDDLLAGITLPDMQHIMFAGEDEVEIEGWAFIPTEGQAPYPTILLVHGGPMAAFGPYYFDAQMLAGAGYAVLMFNPRGSTGYGDDFSSAVYDGQMGYIDYDDLMRGVDYAIEFGIADAKRLGVAGLSYGGFMTTWIVGQTDRFKAAVPENAVTNWVSMYGVADIGTFLVTELLGGAPHEVPEKYTQSSPITFAHRCTTPTLLIVGEHDNRCPPEQSEQFYATLKANGCTVEMMRLPGSSHNGSVAGAPINRRVQNEVMLEWFNRYVLEAAES